MPWSKYRGPPVPCEGCGEHLVGSPGTVCSVCSAPEGTDMDRQRRIQAGIDRAFGAKLPEKPNEVMEAVKRTEDGRPDMESLRAIMQANKKPSIRRKGK